MEYFEIFRTLKESVVDAITTHLSRKGPYDILRHCSGNGRTFPSSHCCHQYQRPDGPDCLILQKVFLQDGEPVVEGIPDDGQDMTVATHYLRELHGGEVCRLADFLIPS